MVVAERIKFGIDMLRAPLCKAGDCKPRRLKFYLQPAVSHRTVKVPCGLQVVLQTGTGNGGLEIMGTDLLFYFMVT